MRAMLSRTRFLKSDRGAALVEFAVVVPILLLVVWGVIDFARAYYTSNSLASAVREGARYAVVQQTPSSKATQIRTTVKNAFRPLGGAALTDAQIFIYDSSATVGRVKVEVQNYTWLKITPIKVFTGGQVSMTRSATFRWEREPTT